ncbi:hypothetical protein FACS189449_00180 [Alphaproteobacteria bacterium]|nr:hypothetical protein FACS189449_00180 [Alphaproteobacteria bacterium]
MVLYAGCSMPERSVAKTGIFSSACSLSYILFFFKKTLDENIFCVYNTIYDVIWFLVSKNMEEI